TIINKDNIIHECESLKPAEIKAIISLNEIKRMAKETYLNNKEIISEVNKDLDISEMSQLRQISTINRIINNIRDKKIINYDNTDDIPIELKSTISGHKFLQHDSWVNDPERILIFANNEKISHLMNSKVWLADGTFKMSPREFNQIYIIHVKIFDNYYPILFAFLPNKSQNTYLRFFKVVEKLINGKFPEYMIMDFEISPMKAFEQTFKNTKIFNCFFHFSQIIWRHIQKNNLVNKYKNNN
ncbi:hypothetical protein DMUE_6294, partial [Dictyocoela muelleri]